MESNANIDTLFQAVTEGVNVGSTTSNTLSTAQGNSTEQMWAKYKATFEEYDIRITNAWKTDAGGLLVFTGLFSAIVGAFIIESYKKLSPDSGNETVVLLRQISLQLASFTNDTYPNLPASEQHVHPSPAIIAVNAMWLMSLVLSITSALFATLLQQWARRYTEMPQAPNSARECARVRSFLFLGTQEHHMSIAVEMVPTLLHLSVLLYLAGLTIFFFTIHKGVAVAVTVPVGVFTVLYLRITILPYLDYKCPYRTPMSDILWYPWNGLLWLAALCIHWVVARVHTIRVRNHMGQGRDFLRGQEKLVNWLGSWKGAYEKHWDNLKNSFEKTIIQGALDAPVDVDRDALKQIFTQLALADRSELLTFMATVPSDEFVRIMTPPFESGRITFRETLLDLIESSALDQNVHGLDGNKRRNCLLVWLAAVLHTTKQLFVPDLVPENELERLLSDVLIHFANDSRMRSMWFHKDTAIRLTSFSICALLAKLIRVKRRHSFPAELCWLEAILQKQHREILSSLDNRMILEFLLRGVFPYQSGVPNQAGDGASEVPAAYVLPFAETLAILMDVGTQPPFNRDTFRLELSDFIDRMNDGDSHARFIADKLRRIFPDFIRTPTPTSEVVLEAERKRVVEVESRAEAESEPLSTKLLRFFQAPGPSRDVSMHIYSA